MTELSYCLKKHPYEMALLTKFRWDRIRKFSWKNIAKYLNSPQKL